MALLFLVFSFLSHGNSCCGQTPSSFPLLHQHEALWVSSSFSQSQALGRVYNDSNAFYIWDSSKKRTLSNLQFSIGRVFEERHQFFLTSSLIRGQWQDTFGQSTSHHFSDTQVGYSYEILPEYTYSPWKPVIFLSAILNIPTGKSIYDGSSLSEGTDVTGFNQWGAGAGLTARKVLFPFTLLTQVRWLRLLPKQFPVGEVSTFNDFSTSAFATYSLREWGVNVTGGLSWSYLSSRTVQNLNIQSQPAEVSSVILSLQKVLSEQYSVGIAYSDQSLVGRPRNTLINQTYSVNINYNIR